MAENQHHTSQQHNDDADTNSHKRKAHPTTTADDGEEQVERIPKKLKNYFQTRKEENDFDDQIEEVDFASNLSKGTEIIKTWHVKRARNLLLELVQIDVGGIVPNSIKGALDDVVKRREEIESLSLFLAERMVAKCQVHSADFINDMLENNRNINPANEISQAKLMFSKDEDEETLREKLQNWQKYTLPNLVRVQQELNLDDNDQEELQNLEETEKEKMKNLMEYEEITHDDDFAYHLDDNHNPLGFGHDEDERIERLNSLDETEIKEVSEKSIWNNNTTNEAVYVHFDNQAKEHIFTEKELDQYDGFVNDEAFYCKYLFDEMLPDESDMKYSESPFTEMKFSLESKYHNPFLFILETTMTMFEKNQTPQEHQTFEVSYLRLATSLFILNCINTELVYLKNRVSKKSFVLMASPIVRGVLDSFIDNRNFSCFKLDPDAYTYTVTTPKESDMVKDHEVELNYVLNGINSALIIQTENEITKDNENIEPVSDEQVDNPEEKFIEVLNQDNEQEEEGEEDEEFLTTDTDTDTDSDIENDNFLVGHPLWDNPLTISQSDIQEMNYYKRNIIDPVSKSLASSFVFLKTDYSEQESDEEDESDEKTEAARIREPVVNQELVTHYFVDAGHFVDDKPEPIDIWGNSLIPILCADHLLDRELNVESQLPIDNSIYRDLSRLMRRGSVMHADSGAYFESFLQLKEYIQRVIEWLSLRNGEKTVTEEDMLNALKLVHNTHFTGGHGSYDFETPYNYELSEFKFSTKPQLAPENLLDLQEERGLVHNVEVTERKDIEIDERFENNDPLTDNNHYADCICHFLGDAAEIPGSEIFCDTFIEFEDGRKLALYSPLIKVRCSSFYEFLNENKKQNGVFNIPISVIRENLPHVNFDNLYEFFEYVYRGVIDITNLGNLLDSYVCQIAIKYNIEEGEFLKDTIIQYNDVFNSSTTLYKLWKDDSTKDFSLLFYKDGEKVEIRVHKFILSSRSEFFRNIIVDKPELESFDLSDVIMTETSLKRFVFYLYYNDLLLRTETYDSEEDEMNLDEDDIVNPDEDETETNEKEEETDEIIVNDENQLKNTEKEKENQEEGESIEEEKEEEEIELTIDEFLEIFKLAHKVKDNYLSKFASRSLAHAIDYTNVSDFLTLSIDYESYELFKACEFVLLSSSKELVEQVTEHEDEREYFNTLRGPIDESNVFEKLSYVMRILNAPSCDLDFLFIYHLDEFHKRNLIWYIIRNISNLSSKILESLQFIQIDDKTNCAQVVKSLANRYYCTLDSFTNIPTKD